MSQSIFNSEILQRRLDKINKSAMRTTAGLHALVDALAQWSKGETPAAASQASSIQTSDINALRYLIARQLNKGRYANRAVLADQILFIIIGALKTDNAEISRTQAWGLTAHSIDSLLDAAYQPLMPGYIKHAYLGLFGLFFIWGSYGMLGYVNHSPVETDPLNLAPQAFAQRPYVSTNVYAFREVMQQATCGYPQAAMLPIEQRVTYLDFIRRGQFALAELTNLEKALSSVDCFYASTINYSNVN
jgi:hypothetical protein